MRSSTIRSGERLAAALVYGLRLELHLTPKPGLVDRLDNGSHEDLSLPLMERSIGRLEGGFREIAESLACGEPLDRQVAIGRETEARMFAEFGSNTHRGGLFLGGLLLAARFRAASDDVGALRCAIARIARERFCRGERAGSHGEAARNAFGVRGIVGEALEGLPSLFGAAVPAFEASWRARGNFEAASFAMMAALMQTAEDTTALHRCGQTGLARIRRDGRLLEGVLARNEDPVPFLLECNRRYRRVRLTMGGVADLLGIAFGWLAYRGGFAEARSFEAPEGQHERTQGEALIAGFGVSGGSFRGGFTWGAAKDATPSRLRAAPTNGTAPRFRTSPNPPGRR